MIYCAEVPLEDFKKDGFKAELEEFLKRPRGLTHSAVVLRAESSRVDDKDRAVRSQSASPSMRRIKPRSNSASPKLEKSFKNVDELIFAVKHSEDVIENRKRIGNALAILLKPCWFNDKKIAQLDIDQFTGLIGQYCASLAVFSNSENPMEKIQQESIKGKVNQVINVPLNSTGLTLLLDACKKPKENLVLIQNLLLLGADASCRDFFKNTVFHYIAKSVSYGDEKSIITPIVELLLAHGASANDIDENGKTPLDIAIKYQSTIIIEVLKAFGAIESSAIKD